MQIVSEQKDKNKRVSGRFVAESRGFLGLTRADLIHYFFGGNASLAIFILLLICVFLFKEAAGFLPDHHRGLTKWRQSGQEFVDILNVAVDGHTRLGSSLNISYYAELNSSSKEEQAKLFASRAVLQRVKAALRGPSGRLRKLAAELEEVREDLADTEQDLAGGVLEPAKRALSEAELSGHRAMIAAIEARIVVIEARVVEGMEEALAGQEVWEGQQLEGADRQAVSEMVRGEFDGQVGTHPWVAELEQTVRTRKAERIPQLAGFKNASGNFRDAIKPMKTFIAPLREAASELKRQAIAAESAPKRKAALLAGAEATEDPEERARKLAQAEAVVVEEPDYDAGAEKYYSAVADFEASVAVLRTEIEAAVRALPEATELTDPSGRQNLARFRAGLPDYFDSLERAVARAKAWRHDKPYSWSRSFFAFLVGKDWITNSSWHDFYGLLPLFTGSLLISLIALVVSVPFALGAAIYVNQVASAREQNLIKPAIEFIQAIPSVVLGFFGIMVLGTLLRDVSQLPWLAWVPGFPLQERLNIINAGLLLAFMAVPTIFTLCEDALNNVPRAYTSGALALGATRMQTILRIIVPTALSGIIAAILLGFGRIIGETMVVLLVAGGKIQIPDFSKGIGVVGEAAHTMTGIIAQETGEVDRGSLHWRALFMVGLVLFSISLAVNWGAQIVLRRFQRHGT
jgi:phosphate transport system permease protein